MARYKKIVFAIKIEIYLVLGQNRRLIIHCTVIFQRLVNVLFVEEFLRIVLEWDGSLQVGREDQVSQLDAVERDQVAEGVMVRHQKGRIILPQDLFSCS